MPFRPRFWLVGLGVLVLVMTCAAGLLAWNFQNQMDLLHSNSQSSAIQAVSFLASWIREDAQVGNWAAAQQQLASYQAPGSSFRFQVITAEGALVVDSAATSPPAAGSQASDAALALLALQQGTPLGRDVGPRLYQAAAPIPAAQGSPRAALLASVDWSVLYTRQQDLLYQQSAAALGFLFLLFSLGILGLFLGVVAPARRLQQLADRTARQGPAMQRAPSFMTYEMDQLGQAFNRMVHRLATQRLTLDKLNRQLEITINTRTRQLAVRNRELLTLNRISNIALAAHSMPEAYQAIVREVSAATGFPIVAVERYDEPRQCMVFEAVTGIELPANGSPFEVPVEQTPSGQVARSGQMLVERDITTHPNFSNATLRSFTVHTFVCLPLKLEGRVMGVISLAHPEIIDLDESLTGWAATLANHIVTLYVRLQAQDWLAENEERFKLALEGNELGLWDWNVASGKVLTNDRLATMLGYAPGQIQPQFSAWAELFQAEDFSAFQSLIEEHLAGRSENFELEMRARTRPGGLRWMLAQGKLAGRDEHGHPLRLVGTLRDIDERKRAEVALRQREATLEAISSAAQGFLASPAWESGLPGVLASLGQATGASRVYVFEALQEIDGAWLSRQHSEWVAPGIPSEMEGRGGKVIPYRASGFGRWEDLLSQGSTISGLVATFPESEQPYLLDLGVRSCLVAPVFVGSRWWGYIGLDDCLEERSWTVAEEDSLRLAAGILGAAIQRQRTEEVVKRLYETEREQRRISQVLRESGATFSASLNYDEILNKILDELPRIAPYDAAAVLLVMEDNVYVARMRGYESYDPEIHQRIAGHSYSLSGTPALRWMAEKHQPLVLADTRISSGLIRLLENDPFRSWAGAPIAFQDQTVAFFCLEKVEPYYYRSEQAELLALFASQVGLSLQNARLFAEALEAVDREHNLNEVTRAISSDLELSAILQNVVRLACDMTGADSGALAVFSTDGRSLTYPYLYNLPLTLSLEQENSGGSLAWEVAQSRKSVRLDEYASHPLARKNWVDAGIRAAIAVPIIAGEACLGGLGLFSYNPEKRFSPRELALVESVARQAGVAIQNARLFQAAERRAHEAETLRQAVAEVTSALQLNEVLEKILIHLGRVVPFDSASVFLSEGDHVRLMAGRNLPNPERILNHVFPADNGLLMEVKRSMRPVVLRDVRADPRFEGWGGNNTIRGWLGLPLILHGEAIGYLALDSLTVGGFNEQDAALVQAFADEVSIAIENARLFHQVEQLAITDPLTGLNNRRYFFDAARRELDRARRYQSPLSVILLDIDHFKLVNDRYGHLAGDRVLVKVAQLCRERLREVDVLARYGGEEFIFLLPQTALDGAFQVAERLCKRVNEEKYDIGDQVIADISVSLGVAELDEACVDTQALIQRADQALYVAKDTGRAHVTRWQAGMGVSHSE